MGRSVAVAALILAALLGPAVAAGDAAKGEKVFRICRACHTAEKGDGNKVGPNLYGVVGAEAGRREDFRYTKAFEAKAAEGLVWTEDNLDTWLTNPQAFIKGTRMLLRLPDASDRADVIAYLRSLE